MRARSGPFSRSTTALWVVPAIVSALGGCRKDSPEEHRGAPPPPSASAQTAGACAGGGGQVADAVSAPFFPRSVAGYCLDPVGETRVFGEGGKLSMDAVCTEAFDGECEVYKRFGLKRVVDLRYVDGGGSPGSVEVYLSQFQSVDGAYGMFTKRVVADSDPAESAPRKLDAGAAGAIGTGRAYVWRGSYLAEIQYNNEQETPAQLKASGDRILTPLAKEIGAKLPGAPALPPAAAALPPADQVRLGVAYAARDVLGVDGAGPGAVGFYKAGDKRWRVLSIARDDADQAKDVLGSFGKQKGATPEKGIADGAFRFVLGGKDGPRVEWVVARSGKTVWGVGDEEYLLTPQTTPAEHDKLCLSRDDKLARLKSLAK